jgi:Type IV secretion system pilin
MKQTIKKFLTTAFAVPVLALAAVVVPALPAFAQTDCPTTSGGQNLNLTSGANCAKGTGQQTDLFGQSGVFKRITDVMLFLIGAISVIMLILGGVRYVLSGGEQAKVAEAKNTILYAVIGVVVAILAYAVVNFVVSSFSAQS